MKTPIGLAALAAFIALLSPTLRAGVPQILNYEGRVVVDAVNFDGPAWFSFALVDAAGTTTYWSNDGNSVAGSQPTAPISLTVEEGLVSVLLGDTTVEGMVAIPYSVFANDDVRLRVWFDDGVNGAQLLSPDRRLAAVGYAMVAGSVPDGAITGAKLAAGAVGDSKLASGLTLGGTTTGSFTGSLTGNATTATVAITAATATNADSATNFTGSLAGNVTGPQSATVVATVGGLTATQLAGGANLANEATDANMAGTIVKRDGTGNFAAGTITGNLTGNATTATTAASATNFTNSLAGNVTGPQSATVVATVGGVSAGNVALGAKSANAATNLNTLGTIVKRDATGNFTVGTITGNLAGNATTANTASSATNFMGTLGGNVTGPQGATVVGSVGGLTAANVATGANLANAATNTNTFSTIVKRDAAGNFTAGTITGNLVGSATSSATAASFSGALAGDVTGIQSATSITSATVTGKALTGFSSTAGTITAADTILSGLNKLNGNVALKSPLASPTFTGTITAGTTNLNGTLTLPGGTITLAPLKLQTGVKLTTPVFGAVEFDGTNLFLSNNSVTPTRKTIAFTDSAISAAQIVAGSIDSAKIADGAVASADLASGLTLGGITVGSFSGSGAALTGLNATNISTGTVADARLSSAVVLLGATQTLTNKTITGSFSGPLIGNVSGSAASFTGALAGNVTGTQGATVVASVGGVTAANLAAGANLANAATNSNTASTIVKRDASGSFTAVTVTATGFVGIGTTTAGFPLSFADTLGNKIALSGQTGNHFGLGVQSNLLQIHTPSSTGDIAFGYGTSTAFVETARVKGTGEFIAKVVTITGGSDVAEPYEVAGVGEVSPLPGMVVAIRTERVGEMRVTSEAYDRTVAGILSGANGIAPGITLRQSGTIADGALPVASIGRVWCWCDADANGPIVAGDLLTTSNTAGHAMRATDRERRDGAVIGKAMSALPSGRGLVFVLVSLK